MDFVMGFAYFVFDALAILLLVAAWQHSRITGLLVLAASYGVAIISRWSIALLYRLAESSDLSAMIWVYPLVGLLSSALAVYGLWDIYRYFKRARSVAPHAA